MKRITQESIADRIIQMRRELESPSQEAFGKPLGVTKSTVSQWESGKTEPAPERLFRIETHYGYRARWVQFGELPKLVRESAGVINDPSNVSYGPTIRGLVPLIAWVSAGRWREPDVTLGEPLGWIPFFGTNPRTFALRVEGDSMEPGHPPGTIIIVDPDREPQPMNLVIAINGEGETTFKRLTRDHGVWYLTPTNSRYPIHQIDSLCKIVGVVIWSGQPEV